MPGLNLLAWLSLSLHLVIAAKRDIGRPLDGSLLAWRRRWWVESRRQAAFSESVSIGAGTELFFDQWVDHFDNTNANTYKQRWFVNDAFWGANSTKPGPTNAGPVFLLVGGEGAESSSSVQVGHAVELARQHNALLLCLEHRFYGESIPTANLSTTNLGLLNSQQALADMANFLGFAKKRYELSNVNKIITFGGSYPGALSAWARLRLPHLVYAAVASSAPVRAVEDFAGYFTVVSESLAQPLVGGSKACVEEIRSSFNYINQKIKSQEGRKMLAALFHSCSPLERREDIANMVSHLAEAFQVLVQYNGQQGPRDVNSTCSFLLADKSGPDALHRLAKLFESWTPESAKSCINYSYEQSLKMLQDIVPNPSSLARQWTFQTCSQFGYFQTCEDDCIFSPLIKLGTYIDLCDQLFGISQPRIKRLVNFSNLWYGANEPDSSRVLYVNGLVDPWHYLSVLKDRSNDQTTVIIPGASHCQDMGPADPSDSTYLKEGKEKIATKVEQWLMSSETVGDRGPYHGTVLQPESQQE